MTTLLPLTADEFDDFLDLAISNYAEQNVAAGRWLEQDAKDLADHETRRMLPNGRDTPGHVLYAIRAEDHAEAVGYLWYATQKRGSASVAFVCQVMVKPPHQRQGHARAALLQLEPLARAAGHRSMALNVFVQNKGAHALYESLGYAVTNFNMAKVLDNVLPPSQSAANLEEAQPAPTKTNARA